MLVLAAQHACENISERRSEILGNMCNVVRETDGEDQVVRSCEE
jgi:hypothetical protein